MADKTIEDRFWSFVDKKSPDECWEWRGGINSTGRGFLPEKTNPFTPIECLGY